VNPTHVFQIINQIREFHDEKQNILEYPKGFQLMIYFPSQNGMISVWGNPSLGTDEKQVIPPTLPNPQKFNRNKNYFLQKLGVYSWSLFFLAHVIINFSKIWQNKKII
jgi:hypothetical protein